LIRAPSSLLISFVFYRRFSVRFPRHFRTVSRGINLTPACFKDLQHDHDADTVAPEVKDK